MLRLLFIAAIALIAIPVVMMLFLKASPQKMATVLRVAAGGSLLAAGTLLSTRGLVLIGGPLAFMGFMMLTRAAGFGPFGVKKSPGQTSSVRTKVLAMELDHDSGDMNGEVLAGPLAGRKLSDLELDELTVLMDECIAAGDQSQALLEAYLDRAHPDWRGDASSDSAGGAGDRRTGTGSARMSRDEAYDILGLERGASNEEIVAAHRRLMKQFHPDQGGSDYLAARINQAKDLLLGSG
ncbi:MAG: DnaJ domain-containing protein [Pseudomonadota bacterium]